MAFNIKSIFKVRDSKRNRKPVSPFLELLEERLECATRVWDGSEIPNGTDGPPPAFGDPTFSSFQNNYVLFSNSKLLFECIDEDGVKKG
jgi:hypothetical protein